MIEALRQALKDNFGHESFREGQTELIEALLSGRDVLGVMPTGAGKSVCYQLPALMLPGVTLVVSPLISLMKDQVMALKASGVAAAYINSSLTPGQQQEAIRRAANGAYKIIYVAPERLETPAFLAFAQRARLSLLAVDEAHCVSQWGQDFRPSYLRIAEFVTLLPKRPPIGAFTATATQQVRRDIAKALTLNDPLCLTTGYDRPNLRFTSVKPTNKLVMLCRFLETMGDACGIIYCSTRKNVEDVCDKLNLAGYSATRYHAGLPDGERKSNQDDFRFDRARLMVATNAFGMGIDKADVRFVVHYNMPKDLESYYQEAGRAGRDGAPAECLLLYSGQDVMTAKWMIEHGEDNPDLTETQRAALRERDMERLKQMTFYATSKACLRGFLLRYFGETDAPERCENCSVCAGEVFEADTGSRRQPSDRQRRQEARLEKRVLRDAKKEAQALPNAWEQALYESLRVLRGLLAARNHLPAYMIFSDASLLDMVKKKPKDMDAFLDISGVGLAKQEQYGELFLRVIRDGQEPNEALDAYEPGEPPSQRERLRQKGKAVAYQPWTEAEEETLRQEFERDETYKAMADSHRRTVGGIKARLEKLGLLGESS